MQMKSELLKIKSLNELNDVGVGIICLATSRNAPTLGLTAPRPARNTHMSSMRRLHHYTKHKGSPGKFPIVFTPCFNFVFTFKSFYSSQNLVSVYKPMLRSQNKQFIQASRAQTVRNRQRTLEAANLGVIQDPAELSMFILCPGISNQIY